MSRRCFTVALISLVAVFASLMTAQPAAAALTWNNAAGDFVWSASSGSLDWSGSAWSDGNAALFAGSGTGTITVAGPVAPTGITFSTAGYTLTGGTINLGSLGLTASASATVNSALALTSSQTWTISAGTTLTVGGSVNNGGNLLTIASSGFTTISGVLSGAGGLSKTSAGTLTLTNNNSFSGGTTVNQGTVVLNSANGNRPTGTGTLTINSGATVDASAQANNFGYYSTGTVIPLVLNSGTMIPNANDHMNTLTMTGGTISAGGSSGGSGLDFNTSNSVAPSITTVASATPAVIAAKTTLETLTTVTVPAGGGAADLTVSGVIAGAGSLLKQGSGVMVLSGVNTYSGGTTISGGTLTIGGAGSLGSGAYSAAIANSGALIFNSSANQTLSGAVSGSGSLLQSGAGVLTLSGSNSYSGSTTITQGAVVFSTSSSLVGNVTIAGGALGTGFQTASAWLTSGRINANPTGTLALTSNDASNVTFTSSYGSLSLGSVGNNSYTGTLVPYNNLYRLGGGVGTLTLPNALTLTDSGGTPQALLVAGNVVLGGSNTYTGGTTLSTGQLGLSASGGGAIPGNISMTNAANNASELYATQNNQFAPGAVMNFVGTAGYSRFELLGSTQALAGINDATAQGVIESYELAPIAGYAPSSLILNGSGSYSYNGYIRNQSGGALSLIWNGSGTQTLLGNDISYTGGTIVNAGTLALGGAGSNGVIRGALTINNGGTVTASAANWSLGYNAGAVSSIAINGGVLAFTDTSNPSSSGGGLSASTITMTGGTISGASTFDWYNGSAVSDTLATNASTATAVVSSGIALRLNSGGALVFNVAQGSTASGTDLLVTGAISNNASQNSGAGVVKIGAGLMSLTAANSYIGGTTVGGGTLLLNFAASGAPASNILPGGYPVAISGGTLDVAGVSSGTTTQTIGALTAGGGGLTISDSGAATTLTAASLSRSPGGTLFVNLAQSSGSGSNTLALTSTAGLGVSSTGLIPYITVTDATATGFAALSGNNIVRFTGTTTPLTPTSNSPTTDYTTTPTDPGYTSGLLQLATGAGSANSLAINAASTGVLDLGGNTLSLTSGGLLVSGSGNYTIQDGQVGATGAALIVNQLGTGTLTLSGSVSGGSGSLTLGGGGTLALTGSNSYTGGTNISNGLLNIAADASLGASGGTVNFVGSGTLQAGANNITLAATRPITINTGATGTIDTQTNTMTIPGVISGGGGLVKAGAGTLYLTNAETYTGPTSVLAGTLSVGTGGTTGTLASTSFNVASGATLAFNRSSAYTATPMTVAGNLSYTSAGQLAMNGTYGANQITAFSGNQIYVNGALNINAGAGGVTLSGTSSGGGGILTNGFQDITTNGSVTFAGTSSAGTYTSGDQIAGVFTATTGTLTFDGVSGPGGCYGIEDGVSGSWASSIQTYGNVVFKGTGHDGGGHNGDVNIGNLTGNGTVTIIGRLEGLTGNPTFTALGGPYNVVIQTTPGVAINGELGSGTDTTAGGNYTVNSGGITNLSSRTINTSGGSITMTSSGALTMTSANLNTTGGNISLTSTGLFTVSGATMNAGIGNIGLTSSAGLSLTTAALNTSSGSIMLASAGSLGLSAATLATNGGNISLASSGLFTVSGATLNAGTGTIGLTSTGAMSLTTAILNTSGSSMNLASVGALSLSVATLGTNGGNIAMASSGALGLTTAALNTGNGNIGLTSSGLFTLSGATLNAGSGVLNLSSSGGYAVTANSAFNAASLVVTDTSAMTISSGATLALNTSGTITNAIGGSGGNLAVSGGPITLLGANTYTGTTTVTSGTLRVGNGGTTGSLGSTAVTVAAGAAFAENLSSGYTATQAAGSGTLSYVSSANLSLNGNYTGNAVSATAGSYIQLTGNVAIGSTGTATITANTGGSGYGAIWAGGATNITTTGNVTFSALHSTDGNYKSAIDLAGVFKATSGTLTFDGVAAPSGGGYAVEDGVSGSWGGAISTYGNVVFEGAGGNSRNSDMNIGGVSGSGTVTVIGQKYGLNTNMGFTASGGPYNVVLETTAGGINGGLGSFTDTTGGGNYTVNSAGSVTFGGRTINAGAGTISLTSSTGYSVTANSAFNAASLVITDSNAIAISSGVTLALNTASTINNVIGGSGGNLVLNGGTVTLTAPDSYSGGTSVNAGQLVLSGAYTSNASTAMYIASGGTLQYAVPSGTRDENTVTYTGAGDLVKTGSGTLRWGAGIGTFNLAAGSLIDIQAGTIDAGSTANEVWSSNMSSLNVASSATISEITYHPAQFDALTGGGSVSTVTGYGVNTLTLGVNNTAAGLYNAAGTATFSGVISGGAALIKSGTGTQIFTGANTYTGGTSILGGTLTVNGALAAGTVAIGTAGTLAGSGTIAGGATLAGNGVVNLSSGTIGGTLGVTGGNWTGTGTVNGAVSSTSGLFTLGSGANLIAPAGLSVSGGTLAGPGTLSGNATVSNNSVLNLSGQITGTLGSTGSVWAGTGTVGGTVTSSGGLFTLAGGATLNAPNGLAVTAGTLNGTGAFAGANSATISAGAFVAPGNNPSTGNAGTVNFSNLNLANGSGLLLDLGAGTASGNDLVNVTGNLSFAGSTALAVNLLNTAALANADYTLLTYGSSSFTNASLVLANSASVLTSRQSYAFDYSVPGKVMLDISGAAANLIWTGTSGSSWDNSGGTTSWTNSQLAADHFVPGDNLVFSNSGTQAVGINGIVAPGSVTVSGTYTFSGTGTITNGTALTVQSGGLLTVANTNNYTLGTNIQGGALVLGTNNALPTGGALATAGAVTLGSSTSNGTFDLAGYNQTVSGLAIGAGVVTPTNEIITASTGNSTLTFNNTSGTVSTFGGTIQDTALTTGGTLSLAVSGGTLDVSGGSTTYYGATTVNAGQLLVNSLPNTSGIAVTGGGSLLAVSYNSAAPLAVASGAAAGISGTNLSLAAVSNSGSVSFSGNSGTITLANLSGPGTTTFAAGATFPTLSAGNVTIAGPASITTVSGGTANLNGPTATITTLSAGLVTLGSSTVLSETAGTQSGGQITGPGGLAMNGPGTVTLAGSNGFSGGTTLGGGLLDINNNSALGTGPFTIAGGSIDSTVAGVTLAGNAQNWNSDFTFGGTQNLNLGSGAVTLGGNRQLTLGAGTLTVGGAIGGGAFGLAKSGPGTMILTGSNTYTGGTTVNQGTLMVGSGGTSGSLASTSYNVASGATLAYKLSSAFTATPMSVAGNVSYNSGGWLTMAGTYGANQVTATGTGVYVSGILYINAGTAGATITGSNTGYAGIYSNGNLNVSTTGNVTLIGSSSAGGTYDGISMGGIFTSTAGTLTLKGTSTNGGAYGIEGGVSGAWGGYYNTYGNVVFDGSGGGGSYPYYHNGDVGVGNLTGNGTVTLIGENRGLLNNGTFTAAGGLPYNVILKTNNGASINGQLGPGTDTTAGGNYTVNSAGSVTFGGRTVNAGSGTISLTSATGYFVTANSTLQGGSLVITDTNSIALSPSATLTLNAPGTFSNVISGSSGNLMIAGGAVALTGASSYGGGTTISGGTLQLGNGGTGGSIDSSSGVSDNGTLAFNRADNPSFALAVSGIGGLRQAGAGTLILTANNSYSGPTAINSGTLQLGNGGSINATSGVNDNGTLAFSRSDNFSFSPAISGNGGVNQLANNVLTLTGTSTYSGPTTVSAGTLNVAGALGNTALAVGGGAALAGSGTIGGSVTVASGYATATQGAINLVDGSIGTLTLSGGGTALTLGTGYGSSVMDFEISASSLGVTTTDQIALTGAYLNMNGSATINLTQLGSNALSAGTYDLISFAAMSNSGGTFTLGQVPTLSNNLKASLNTTANYEQLIIAPGTPRIAYWTGASSASWLNTGNWIDSSGMPVSSVPGSIGGGGYTAVYFSTGSSPNLTTTLDNDFTVGSLTFTSSSSAVTINGTNTLTIATSAANSMGINDQAVAAQTIGANVALGTPQTWTVASGGSLAVGGVISGASSNTLTLAGAGTVILTAANTYSGQTTINSGVLQLSNSGAVSGAILDNGSLVFATSQPYSGVITGTGGVTIAAPAAFTLGGGNGYTGGTTVSGGGVQLGNASALGTGGLVLAGGALDLGGFAVSVPSLSLTGGTLSGGGQPLTVSGPGPIDAESGAASANLAGNVGLNKTTGGSVLLSGSNSYTGGTSIEGGVLQLGSDTALPNSGGLSVNAGTLDLNGHNPTVGTVAGAGLISNGSSVAATINVNATAPASLDAMLADGTGTTGLVKSGSGTLVVTNAANSYSGGTTIAGGVLQLAAATALGSSSGVLAVNGGTLDLAGKSPTIGSLVGASGMVTSSVTSATLTAGAGGGSSAFGGVIVDGAGPVALLKIGGGTLALSGVNGYSGGTTINGGVLSVSNSGNLGSGNLAIGTGTLQTTGTVMLDAARTITLTDSTSAIDTPNLSDSVTIPGPISGSGALNKTGSGTLALANPNGDTYSGDTNVAAGTLLATVDNALSPTSDLVIGDGATVILDFGGASGVGGDSFRSGVPSLAAPALAAPALAPAGVSTVPEPSGLLLLLAGALASLAVWRRRNGRS